MVDGGLKSLIIAVLLVGLCMFAMLSFAIQFQDDMGANQTLINTSQSGLNQTYSALKRNLTGAEDTANATRTSFESEEAKSEFGSLTFKSIVGVGKSFTGTISGFFNIVFNLIKTNLGFDKNNPNSQASFAVILGTFSAIVLVVIIFYAWRVYRAGS